MLNYYPILREHQIFRDAGAGCDGPKSGHSGATFGDPWPSYQQVTGRTGIARHNCRGFKALTEVIELGGMDMQLHVL